MHISTLPEISPCNEGISLQRPVYLIRMDFCTAWLTRIASRDEVLLWENPRDSAANLPPEYMVQRVWEAQDALLVMKT